MLNIKLEFDNEVQFSRTFTRFVSQLRDLRDVWPAVVIDLREITQEQFTGQGVGDSGQWAALSPRYAAWKRRHYPGKTILRRTDRLIESLTGNKLDSIVNLRPDHLEFGTRVPYAIFHQRGSGKQKRRKIFDLNERQRTRIMKSIQRRLLTAGQESGFALG